MNLQQQEQHQSKTPDVSDICIPRMEKNVRREFILNILRKMKIGYIERISEIPLKKEPTHKRVIAKIKWNSTDASKTIQHRLQNNEPVNVVYELPLFWKIVLCKQ
jgi:hypothetical protein